MGGFTSGGFNFDAKLRRQSLDRTDLFIIGGGVTENWSGFGPLLKSPARIAPARFGNTAGIIGAALAAAQL